MRRIACLVLIMASTGSAYIRQQVAGATTPLMRVDNTAIQFGLNQLIVPGYTNSASGSAVIVMTSDSNPQQAVHKALATWNGVATANINFLPLILTAAGINHYDYQHTIAFGTASADLSLVGGALALTTDYYVTGPANAGTSGNPPVSCTSNCTYPAAGDIFDSDVILNPEYTFSTTGAPNSHDFEAVIQHELGHSLSANHTGILGASMFQFPTQHFLTGDDVAFVNSAYPLPSGGTALGTISGKVTAGAGAGVPYALLTAIDTTQDITVGGVTNPDGTYSFNVPPGNYQIYAEPLNGVVPINIYLLAAQASQAAAAAFQTTLYSGTLDVTANTTQTANISVTSGASTLAGPIITCVPVNAPVTGGSTGGPATVPSGGMVDLVLSGPGFDATLTTSNFTFYSSEISILPNSVRVDRSQTFSGNPLLRVTLSVAATTKLRLASFLVTSGSNTISFSGALVIVPPAPTFVAAGVVSAAAYTGIPGEVTPGGLYTIYDIPNSPNLGPAVLTQHGSLDPYGFLPATLAGVTVTFDGIDAPMFLSWDQQLNFQVPYELAGRTSTQLVVNYFGSSSPPVTVPVVSSQPLFFTSGGNAIAVNLPGRTLNSAQNPAPKGSYVEIYGTGVGQVSYTIFTGQAAPEFPAGFNGSYKYSMGGSASAPAYFGGWTPTAIGLAQWDLLVPSAIGSGAVSVIVQDAGGANNQAQNATIFVQ